MWSLIQSGVDSGLFESASQLVVAAGSIVLLLMFAALAGFAYKSLRGDGIRWPEDVEDDPEDEPGVRRTGDDDDEWDYY